MASKFIKDMRPRGIEKPSQNSEPPKFTVENSPASLSSSNSRSRGQKFEQLVENDLKQRGFLIRERNFWFRRRFEVDLWVWRKDTGQVWIEVKSMPHSDFLPTRVRPRQRGQLLRGAAAIQAGLWFAFVDSFGNILYLDGVTGESIEC